MPKKRVEEVKDHSQDSRAIRALRSNTRQHSSNEDWHDNLARTLEADDRTKPLDFGKDEAGR